MTSSTDNTIYDDMLEEQILLDNDCDTWDFFTRTRTFDQQQQVDPRPPPPAPRPTSITITTFGPSTSRSSLAEFTSMSSSSTPWTRKDMSTNVNGNHGTPSMNYTHNHHYIVPPAFQNNDNSTTSNDKKEKKFVTHNYRDYSTVVPSHYSSRTIRNSMPRMPPRMGTANHFPIKLYHMLEHIDLYEPQLTSVISWQPHGRCFKVHHPKIFEEIVLQRFFKQHKYTSFQRQLNIYGFRRITSGKDRGSYYHELFLRGKKCLCFHMERTSIKGNGGRMSANPKSEPNFYDMPYLGPHHISENEDDDDIISDYSSQQQTVSLSEQQYVNQKGDAIAANVNTPLSCATSRSTADCTSTYANGHDYGGIDATALQQQQQQYQNQNHYHHFQHHHQQQQQNHFDEKQGDNDILEGIWQQLGTNKSNFNINNQNHGYHENVYQWMVQDGDSSSFTQKDFCL